MPLARRISALALSSLAAASCAADVSDDLLALGISDEARAALSRLRFLPLRVEDRIAAGDLVLCGPDDRVLLSFSRRLMTGYLGIDAELLLPELFPSQSATEVYLEIPPRQLLRVALPAGIGATVSHPNAWVREAEGSPTYSADLRAIDLLFKVSDRREVFAKRGSRVVKSPPGSEPTARRSRPRRIGITPFPRMGPKDGVVIDRVMPDSPAKRAKLVSGDRILAVNGQRVNDIIALQRVLKKSRGDVLVLRVRRARSRQTEDISLHLTP